MDNMGSLILDPQIADRGDYTMFIGYFAVTPWNLMYSMSAASQGEKLVSIVQDITNRLAA